MRILDLDLIDDADPEVKVNRRLQAHGKMQAAEYLGKSARGVRRCQ